MQNIGHDDDDDDGELAVEVDWSNIKRKSDDELGGRLDWLDGRMSSGGSGNSQISL